MTKLNVKDQPARESTPPPGDGKIHELKCWPEFFSAIASGDKRHDLRRATDRQLEVGDRLRLKEFNPETSTYTGQEQMVLVTYITSEEKQCALSNEALHPDFCILSIVPIED